MAEVDVRKGMSPVELSRDEFEHGPSGRAQGHAFRKTAARLALTRPSGSSIML
jgi:hypothetical protein